jgi:uncharacterized protein YcbK (DUF882 family)
MINNYIESLTGISCERRFFLKASSLVVLSSLFSFPSFSYAGKTLPEGKLSLVNTHTNDKLTVKFRNASGKYDPGALKDINWILRCHFDDKMHAIDRNVLEFLNLVDKRCGSRNEIQIISGYRSPEYNHKLMLESRGVVKSSLHQEGKAIDVRISGIGLSKLREEALKLKLGGVGYYKKSNFVHLDSGRFRTW